MKRIFKLKNCIIVACLLIATVLVGAIAGFGHSYAQMQEDILLDNAIEDEVLFLSDIPYTKAQVGWGKVALDKTQDNGSLILILNGYSTVFDKGIWAHATSTVEYDITKYKEDYTYFTTYYGVNTTAQNNGNGVKFYVYTSVDGKQWDLRTDAEPRAVTSGNGATQVKIDIREANFIRLYAHNNGSNGSDHAVWADAKLVKEGYTGNVAVPVEDFDAVIKANYQSGPIQNDMKLTLLQRNFIKKVGQYQLRSFIKSDPKHREMLEWFLYNEEALRLWTVGGNPNGSYLNALRVLSNLYSAHKADLSNENVTSLGTKYKDLYLRMMLALSLTHSSSIGLWIGGNQLSDAVTRYEIYKDMHLNNKLASNGMFERLTVEEMRWLMHVNIDDEEIEWLRDYSAKRYPSIVDRFNPYKYIKYTFGYSYYRPQYYSQENYAKWDQKYNLSEYNITYKSGKPKLWIVFEEGAVCGGLSKTAANLYGVWGTPASVVGQPAHAAYIYYYEVGGKGAWQLAYSVVNTGWANTQGYSRMPNDWGNLGSGVVTNTGTIQSASYFFLSQEAQNEYEKYEQAELIMLQQDVYKNDKAKLEQIYRDTLAVENIHWEAWLGLVNLYIGDSSKTETDLINLATEISEALTYHPLPMYDLTRRLGTKVTSPENRARLMMLQEKTLRQATKATSANTLQYKEVPVVAQALLGEINSEIATFSFDGTNAGKITLSRQLQSAQVNWSYSLDGGKTWRDCFEHAVQLTAEEIASITVDNDIKVHISGLDYSAANIYTINITKRTFPSGVITINDEEDRMFGATNEMEWTLTPNDGESWSSFANTNPIFSGNKRVYVRIIASGTQIASDPVYYTFTANNSDDTKWYIQSKNLSVVDTSATSAGNKDNILDGNINTYWRAQDKIMPAHVTIKLNEPRYISGLDYVPDKSAKYLTLVPYGRARNVKIYVSMNGTDWELAASKQNLGDNDGLKHIQFPEPKKALYVKFEAESVYDSEYTLLAVSVIKLYENVLVNGTPRADVNYNIINPTNQSVTAELINPIRPITVTNNDGKTTYTFTENGSFTFEFEDADGNKGTATATVDWIDKTPPTANVTFSTTELTNEEVVATLTFDKKPITILSKDVQIAENPVDKTQTITFLENATYELEFMDQLGNIGTKTIAVDWIDKEAPTAEFEYNTIHMTDEPVTVKLVPNEPVTITNNDGKDTYTFDTNGEFTFKFVDQAGNEGSATTRVTWISAQVARYELEYSTEQPTNQDVTVTLELEEGYRIINNGGSNVYTFTENGSFDFQYVDGDDVSNVGAVTAFVDWIDKTPPTAELEYIKEKEKVTVKVINPSEEITFKEGNGVYVYTELGEYEIIIYDKVGNESKLTVVVDSMGDDTDPPIDPGDGDGDGDTDPDDGDEDGDGDGDDKEDPDDGNEKPGGDGDKEDPDEPNLPGHPDNPSNPDQPDNNNDSSIDEPIDVVVPPVLPGRPSLPDNIVADIGNNGSANTQQPESENKQFTLGNVLIELPAGVDLGNGTLKNDSFELPDELKDRFGAASEFYHFYVLNDKSEKTGLQSEKPIKISIKLNKSKHLAGVYEITDDNTVKPVKYTKNGDNVELSTNGLGKYVVSYEELSASDTDTDGDSNAEEDKAEQKENDNNWLIWGAVAGGVVVVMGAGFYFFKKQ